jgi:hypothetical protein
MFAAHRAGQVAGSTVCNNVARLHAYHIAHALPWPTPPHFKYIITSAECTHPDSSRVALQPPASLPLLCVVYKEINIVVGLQIAVCACALAAFYGQFHMGELLPKSNSAYNPWVHSLHATWTNGPTPSIMLCWTKG